MDESYDYLFKLILIGDSGVGKTSFFKRYVDNIYDGDYISTIGVDFKIKTIKIGTKTAKLQLWDTAGQERFSAITKSYYRGAHGIILIFDLTDKNSFNSLENWFRKIDENSSENREVILLGSKVDLKDQIVVTKEEVNKFLESKNLPKEKYFEVSSKENTSVADVFDNLAKVLVKKNEKGDFKSSKDKGLFERGTKKTRGCC